MNVTISTAPGTWGVEHASDPGNPIWTDILDEAASIGFDGIELGPFGYFPEDPVRIKDELDSRGLRMAGGFVMQPFHRAGEADAILALAERTCHVLAGAGARHVVLIEALVPERATVAGRTDEAPRLDEAGWATFKGTVERVARLAADHGLTAVFHPHAGTVVEFGDEVEHFLEITDPELVGFCVDTGHSVYGGMDPVDLIRRHADRISYLHLKDVRAEALRGSLAAALSFEDAVAAGVFCPLGAGSLDFVAIRSVLADIDYHGWGTFEQDRLLHDPAARSDAESSIDHLREVGIAANPPVTHGVG